MHVLAVGRVRDLGVVLHAPDAPVGVLEHRDLGAPGDVAVATNPSGTSVTASKWLIQTVWFSGSESGNSVEGTPGFRCMTVRPYSPAPPPPTAPPSCSAISCAP